jgi:hypothetical protein
MCAASWQDLQTLSGFPMKAMSHIRTLWVRILYLMTATQQMKEI